MDEVKTQWDINLRANLRLWPEPAPHVRRLAGAIGEAWNEYEIAQRHFAGTGAPDVTRAIRQTFEAMAYDGLVYRSSGDQLLATRLGEYVLSFLGLLDGYPVFANSNNRILVAEPLIMGLSALVEVRVIWALMRELDDRLSNEELNRAMGQITRIADVPDVAALVRQSRATGNPQIIGPRVYDEAGYNGPSISDQRKAMNPHFLLAGGGGLFIDVEAGDRRLSEQSLPLIDAALNRDLRLLHAATDSATIAEISRVSLAPRLLRRS